VDDNLLDFLNLIESVRFGTFNLNLPSTFSEPEPKDPIITPKKGGGLKGKENKGNKNKNEGKKINKRSSMPHPLPNSSSPKARRGGYLLPTKTYMEESRGKVTAKCAPAGSSTATALIIASMQKATWKHVSSPAPRSLNSMTSCRSSETATIDSTGWDLAVSNHPSNHLMKPYLYQPQ
jgi:hypothetical protein